MMEKHLVITIDKTGNKAIRQIKIRIYLIAIRILEKSHPYYYYYMYII